MRSYRVYLHPRTLKRKIVVWYHRVLFGRSRNPISALERQLLKQFYFLIQEPDIQLYHYVNGVFAKEMVHEKGLLLMRFRLVDNESKIHFFKKDGRNNNMMVETYVSLKTAALMNRLFDKQFTKMLIQKKEAENKDMKQIFAKFSY